MAVTITQVPLDRILTPESLPEPDRLLRESMAEFGQFIAIELHAQPDGTYRLDEGRKRLATARKLGWTTLRAVVELAGKDVLSPDLKAIIVNTHRKNLQQLDLAEHAWRVLRESDCTQAKLARQIHVNRSSLARMLKVRACPDLVSAIQTEGLEFGAAKALAPLLPADRAELLSQLRQMADEHGKFPSVRQVEELIRVRQGQAALPNVLPAHLPVLMKEFQTMNTPTKIRVSRGKQTQVKVSLVLDDTDEYWINALVNETGRDDADEPMDGSA